MNTMLPNSCGIVDLLLHTMEVLDMTMRTRISSAATGGAWSLSEWTVPPYSAGLPNHWHVRTQTLCYVLDGMLAWTLGQHTFTVAASDCVVMPPGTQHSFFNPAAAPATLLMWSVPGGIEQSIAAAVRLPASSGTLREQYDYFSGLSE